MLAGEQAPVFIAAEFYKTSTAANPNHITKVGQLVDGGAYWDIIIHSILTNDHHRRLQNEGR